MPALNPPPVIDANLGLIVQPLQYLGGRIALVTFAVDVGAHTPADAQDAIDDFQANWNTHIGGNLSTGVNNLQPYIRLGDGSAQPLEAVGAGAAVVGASTADWVSASLAVLIKKTTGLGGKKNRGRTYVPFWPDSAHIVEPGLLDTAEQTALQAQATAFFNQLVTDSTPMVIANKHYAVPALPARPYVDHVIKGAPVTGFNVEQVLATQRRRLRS